LLVLAIVFLIVIGVPVGLVWHRGRSNACSDWNAAVERRIEAVLDLYS
jgi:hypothetical protein